MNSEKVYYVSAQFLLYRSGHRRWDWTPFFFSIPAGCLPPQTSAQFPEAIKLVCTWQSVTAISCEMWALWLLQELSHRSNAGILRAPEMVYTCTSPPCTAPLGYRSPPLGALTSSAEVRTSSVKGYTGLILVHSTNHMTLWLTPHVLIRSHFLHGHGGLTSSVLGRRTGWFWRGAAQFPWLGVEAAGICVWWHIWLYLHEFQVNTRNSWISSGNGWEGWVLRANSWALFRSPFPGKTWMHSRCRFLPTLNGGGILSLKRFPTYYIWGAASCGQNLLYSTFIGVLLGEKEKNVILLWTQ